jgi:hypothetical protein
MENGSGKVKRQVSEESVDEEVDVEDFIPTPPDGGWGWMVVVASFFTYHKYILRGLIKSRFVSRNITDESKKANTDLI